jgi:hypothetical protein
MYTKWLLRSLRRKIIRWISGKLVIEIVSELLTWLRVMSMAGFNINGNEPIHSINRGIVSKHNVTKLLFN